MADFIVFATASLIPRRIVRDGDPSDPAYVGPGESLLILNPGSVGTVQSLIAAHVGVSEEAIPSGRAAVVDKTGSVVAIVVADAALDTHPHASLVNSDIAMIGDRFVGGTVVGGALTGAAFTPNPLLRRVVVS